MQLPYGVLDPQAADEVIPAAQSAGMAVIARGVLGAGLLDERLSPDRAAASEPRSGRSSRSCAAAPTRLGVSAVQLAIWYVRANSGVDTILVGTTSTANADEAIAAMATPLPGPDVIAAIHDVATGAR